MENKKILEKKCKLFILSCPLRFTCIMALLGHLLTAEKGNESPDSDIESATAETSTKNAVGIFTSPMIYTVLT